MPKKLKKLGKSTSHKAQVQNISDKGIWLLVAGQEFYMPFDKFPWFLQATIQQIYNLQFFHGHHLHWPDLDVDVDLEALKHPQRYPLQAS